MADSEVKLIVTMQPWLSPLIEELGKAGNKAAQRGVPAAIVLGAVQAALREVVKLWSSMPSIILMTGYKDVPTIR